MALSDFKKEQKNADISLYYFEDPTLLKLIQAFKEEYPKTNLIAAMLLLNTYSTNLTEWLSNIQNTPGKFISGEIK